MKKSATRFEVLVLARDRDARLQVMLHVGAQQVVQVLHGDLAALRAEELDEEIRLDELDAAHDALEVVEVLV